ncbi:helix-turn-helix domain-containing protein [Lachnospiraceae bacterium NSJ-143]|nr:helix-turn-helix domain-containing protein [Lachnospiraceae bacterium NSJ-143]
MSGIGHSTISRIENEEISPTLYEIEKIAHALKISPYELFDFTRT